MGSREPRVVVLDIGGEIDANVIREAVRIIEHERVSLSVENHMVRVLEDDRARAERLEDARRVPLEMGPPFALMSGGTRQARRARRAEDRRRAKKQRRQRGALK